MPERRSVFLLVVINICKLLAVWLLPTGPRASALAFRRCLSPFSRFIVNRGTGYIVPGFYPHRERSSRVSSASGDLEAEVIFGDSLSRKPPSLEPVAQLLSLKAPPKTKPLTKEANLVKLHWAQWEIRRFSYKLGTANKQMRKLVEKYNHMRNTFTYSKEDLDAIRKAKRQVAVKLRIASRLRRLFIVYKNGLENNLNPNVPYVPLKYRSQNAPQELYGLGTRKYHNAKRHRRLKQQEEEETSETHTTQTPEEYYKYLQEGEDPYGWGNDALDLIKSGKTGDNANEDLGKSSTFTPKSQRLESVASSRANRTVDITDKGHHKSANRHSATNTGRKGKEHDIEREILGLIAESQNQAIRKKRLVNDPAIAKIQSRLRNKQHRRKRMPKGL
ncbi:hypothetical protein BgAZ_200480 [Babesia gibsoni]|uniref:Uncharacterized protein n=1 Tax=Babesia gibsoni TaxID=33632 RepID=A0AAD8LRI2_BABGI|nr:hypothetical protein BgAZ_200480 [Babesia gibsoni]